jgi:hypothetical protein
MSKLSYLVKKLLVKSTSFFNPNLVEHIYKVLSVLNTDQKQEGERILILCPEAGLKAHYNALLIIGKVLSIFKINTVIAKCFSCFERCPVHSAAGLKIDSPDEQKKSICNKCIGISTYAPDYYGLKTLNLEKYSNSETDKIINQVLLQNKNDYSRLVYDRIPFGLLCEHDLRICFKVLNLASLTEVQLSTWRALIQSSLKMYLIVKNITKKLKITHVIYYNDYSLFIPVRILFERLGKNVLTFTHAYNLGIDRKRLIFNNKISFLDLYTNIKNWNLFKKVPLNKPDIRNILEDILVRFEGKSIFTYSPARIHIKENNYKDKRKKIIAYTSSPDESSCLNILHALNINPNKIKYTFGDDLINCQTLWIKSLLEFCHENSDIELFIRIHPREYSGKREGQISEHLHTLKKSLKLIPQNCVVVWPNDSISSYNLAENADLILTAWSSIGMELARLGVPFLSCVSGYAGLFNDELFPFTTSANKYFKNVRMKISAKPSLDYIQEAFRWWNYYFLSNSIKMDHAIKSKDINRLGDIKISDECSLIKEVLLTGIDPRDLKIASLKRKKFSKNEHTAEIKHIKDVIFELLYYFMSGKRYMHNKINYRVETSDDMRWPSKANVYESSIKISRNAVTLELDSSHFKNNTKIVKRLAQLLQ